VTVPLEVLFIPAKEVCMPYSTSDVKIEELGLISVHYCSITGGLQRLAGGYPLAVIYALSLPLTRWCDGGPAFLLC